MYAPHALMLTLALACSFVAACANTEQPQAAPPPPPSTYDKLSLWRPPSCTMPTTACAPATPATGSIRMERTECFGSCAVYTVEVAMDGNVFWHGERFVEVEGAHTGKASPREVAELFAMMGRACFSTVEPKYEVMATDCPWTNLTVTADDQTKVVRHYRTPNFDESPTRPCEAPDLLELIEHQVDVVSGTRRWIGTGFPDPPERAKR